ncbi:hypothetical protein [Nocardia sp. NPDC050175]|uniref:hypothetical protein n=1 Tax=Nocardia sp. NPDC050175 TaxID=3364317 RepID=UPI0037B86AAB
MKPLEWSTLLPIAGAVVGGLTALSATVALLMHTTPAEPAEPVAPPPNSTVESTPNRTIGIDLPHAITDPGSCRRVSVPHAAIAAFTCATGDGKPLTAVKYTDNDAARDVASTYPNSWPATGAALGRYVAEQDSTGSWVLRWMQTTIATVIEVPGFKDKASAEQWFREIDPQLEPR